MSAKHAPLRKREAPPYIKRFLLKFQSPAPINQIRSQISLNLKPRVLVLEPWFGNDLRLTIDRRIDPHKIASAVDKALGYGPHNPWRMELAW